MSIRHEFISIDLETTNLYVHNGEIVQIGVILFDLVYDGKEWSYKETNRYSSYVRYMHPETLDKKAMEVNRIPRSILLEAPFPHIVKEELIEWWEEQLQGKKLLPVGQNYGGFDKVCLGMFLGQYYDEMFDYHSFDTFTLAKTCQLKGLLKLEDHQLGLATLADHFGILRMDHSAIPDALNTVEVMVSLLNLLEK